VSDYSDSGVPDIMSAIEEFLATVTVPILFDRPNGLVTTGTGTFLQAEERLLFITAAHVLDDEALDTLILPHRTNGTIHRLDTPLLYLSQTGADIAIIELRQPDMTAPAIECWHKLTIEQIARASLEGRFILSGYPFETTDHTGPYLRGRLVPIHTGRLQATPAWAERPIYSFDQFFALEKEGMGKNQKALKVPNLVGSSGGPIWEYYDPGETASFWTPKANLSVVGVLASARKGQYIRAHSWEEVPAIFRQFDTTLAERLEEQLAKTQSEVVQVE